MKIKRKINYILLFIATILPITTFSCSKSWTKWSVEGNKSPKIKYDAPMAKYEKQYEVAKDLSTKYNIIKPKNEEVNIYLSKVNNQYELVHILIEILNLKQKNIALDQFWNDLDSNDEEIKNRLPNYLNNIKQKIKLNFNFPKYNFSVNWDITNITKEIKRIYANKIANKKDEKEIEKDYLPKYDFVLTSKSKDVLNEDGTPKDLGKIQENGSGFLKYKSVNSLLTADINFALKLSKLVYLPKLAFEELKKLMGVFDKLWINIYNDKLVKGWIDNHDLLNKNGDVIQTGIDFAIQKNGAIKNDYINNQENNLNQLLGIFMTNGLK